MPTAAVLFRPTRLSEMFGQKKIVDAIKVQIASKRVPSAWAFIGESGGGKTTMARIISRSLQCTHSEFGEPCEKCSASSQFAIFEINASEVNGVDAIQAIAQTSRLQPPYGRKRIIILDEAQRLTKHAQNLLLKYFEDAPRSTVWIITTTDPEQILKALMRRCGACLYRLRPLSAKGVEEFLEKYSKKLKLKRSVDDLITAANEKKISAPGFLLNALEKYNQGLDPDECVADYTTSIDTLRICRALLEGQWDSIRAELNKATVEDFKTVQLAVLGYLRQMLLAKQDFETSKKVARAIYSISTAGWGFDDVARSACITAQLRLISARFK